MEQNCKACGTDTKNGKICERCEGVFCQDCFPKHTCKETRVVQVRRGGAYTHPFELSVRPFHARFHGAVVIAITADELENLIKTGKKALADYGDKAQ